MSPQKNYTGSLKCLSLLIFLFNFIYGFAQEETRIDIEHADLGLFEKSGNASVNRLLGNVIFSHEGIIGYCDSAYFYPGRNIVDAYSNVHIIQGDTLDLYSDFLTYNGTTKLAEAKNNVLLKNDSVLLTTDNLNYDRIKNLAYYFKHGKIKDDKNNLYSINGLYNTKTKIALFSDSVLLRNPETSLYSDTLEYNTDSEIAFVVGPTRIISEESYIYCEAGWYETQTDISNIWNNTLFESDEQIIRADSLYYEKETGFVEAFNNVELIDTTDNIIIRGNHAVHYEETQTSTITDKALFIKIDNQDSIFIHADTLRSNVDTSGTYKLFRAYYRVKLFRDDLQGKCDSLVYSDRDSVIQLFKEPVIWSENKQISSEFIKIFSVDNMIDYVELQNAAFIVIQDSIYFNQIKGKDMIVFFREGKPYRIDVKGNGQTLYFPKDENEIIGINRAECADLTIYIKDNEIDRIKFITKPDASLFPLDQVSKNEYELEDFKWLEKYRPKKRSDIFWWIK